MTPTDEELLLYLDGALDAPEAAALEQAAASDRVLAARIAQLRTFLATARDAPLPPAAPALRAALAERLGPETSRPIRFARLLQWALPLTAVAALAFLALPNRTLMQVPTESLAVAAELDLYDSLDALGLESAEDVEVIASLESLEATP